MLFRRVKKKDLADIYNLAGEAGHGLTSLCKDKKELDRRIDLSEAAFKKKGKLPVSENYFFVLEDTETQKIVGTSAIESAVGHDVPWYAYRVSRVSKVCKQLDLHLEHTTLMLNNDLNGFSEVATLFLDKAYRKNHNGLLLSRARFLFMASFPERFAEFVIAEMRGISDTNAQSPVWDSLGSHFFKIPFAEADALTGLNQKQFIADLLPHNVIYTNLLSKAAQAAIGKPHASTKPAMRILEKEGFRYNGYVDIFDAGPTLKARVKEILTVKNCKQLTIKSISDHVHSKHYFISNNDMDFKAVQGELLVKDETCIMSRKEADLLKVKTGDVIRAVSVRSKEQS